MIQVLLVDDEVLALEYLKNLVDWEKLGFQVIGCATSGKKALELFAKYQPELVISDIKMIGMDGLELTMKLKAIKSDVVIFLLSAYKDFEYAKKGIQYGVENYLLKHEMSEETLTKELMQVKKQMGERKEKEKVYQKYFVNQLIYNPKEINALKDVNFGNRFFLVMIHKKALFQNGSFTEQKFREEDNLAYQSEMEKNIEDTIFYVSDVRITDCDVLILYRIENEVSKYTILTRMEQKIKDLLKALQNANDTDVNILYSYEINQEEISDTFQKMARQIHYAIFWENHTSYALSKLPVMPPEKPVSWSDTMNELELSFEKEQEDYEEMFAFIFDQVRYPSFCLNSCREMLHVLETVLRKIEEKEGISIRKTEEKYYSLMEIQAYYTEQYQFLYYRMHKKMEEQYSKIVLSMMRYIRKNSQKELNLEQLGMEFQMNGVYLGQVFKKETGETFLKYLTNVRMEKAKMLLDDATYNITEVSEIVGYKTSQYFSQTFSKNVGMTPQEYRKWNQKKQ